jgi:hypothetical protein
MKVFYWTEPLAEYGRRFYQVDSDENNFVAEVPGHNVGPESIRAMLDDGFTEISSDTAYKLGLPT